MRNDLKHSLLIMERTMRFPKTVDKDLVDIWEAVLIENKVEPQDVKPACVALMSDQTDFPTPSEFIAACHELRRKREFAARAAEIQPAEKPKAPLALPEPATPEQIQGLKQRFNNVLAKMRGTPPPPRKYALAKVRKFDSTDPIDYPDELTKEERENRIRAAGSAV